MTAIRKETQSSFITQSKGLTTKMSGLSWIVHANIFVAQMVTVELREDASVIIVIGSQ